MGKNLAVVQVVFNLEDPYQSKLYRHVIPEGTTNKSDAGKRIFQRDMEGYRPIEKPKEDLKIYVEGFI